MLGRMPRLQVDLQDDVYSAVGELGISASDVLEEAVRARMQRQDALTECDCCLAALWEEVGEPTTDGSAAAAEASRTVERLDHQPRFLPKPPGGEGNLGEGDLWERLSGFGPVGISVNQDEIDDIVYGL